VITPNDLKEKPLIISSQELVKNEIAEWIGGNQRSLNIVGTFNLLFNAKLMVEEKMGYALTLEHLYNESEESIVCFKPLSPKLTIRSNVIWKKYKVFSKPVEIFLKKLQEEIKLYCKQ
ncbi:MAG: LysR substrate-binding domain-containing protein, partial [Faecalibacillus sp.]